MARVQPNTCGVGEVAATDVSMFVFPTMDHVHPAILFYNTPPSPCTHDTLLVLGTLTNHHHSNTTVWPLTRSI